MQIVKFDIRKGKEQGVFISAGRQHGKSNLAKTLADYYIADGCILRVFDNSQSWLKSNIPYKITVDSRTLNYYDVEHPLDKSVLFDISRLYPFQQQIFVSGIIGSDFNHIVDYPSYVWIIYFIEEAQLLLPSGSLRARHSKKRLEW